MCQASYSYTPYLHCTLQLTALKSCAPVIDAVAPGEKEAAKSLGMTEFQSYVRIILPQAFTMSIPPLTNLVIGMLKGTALIFNVGVVDMMRKADLHGRQ